MKEKIGCVGMNASNVVSHTLKSTQDLCDNFRWKKSTTVIERPIFETHSTIVQMQMVHIMWFKSL